MNDGSYWNVHHVVDGVLVQQAVVTVNPDYVMELGQSYANTSGYKVYVECKALNIQREFDPQG